MAGWTITHHLSASPEHPAAEGSTTTAPRAPAPTEREDPSAPSAATRPRRPVAAAATASSGPPLETLVGEALAAPEGPRPPGSVLDVDVDQLPAPAYAPPRRHLSLPAPEVADDERAVRRARLAAVGAAGGGTVVALGALALWLA